MLLKSIAYVMVKYAVKYAGNAASFGFAGDALLEVWDLWNKSGQDQQQKLAEVEQLVLGFVSPSVFV